MSSMTILALFLILNAITCILYGIDKWKAIHGAWRIREVTLLTWAALGGSLGAWGLSLACIYFIIRPDIRNSASSSRFLW